MLFELKYGDPNIWMWKVT